MKIIYSLLLAFMATVTFAQPTSEINGRVYIDVNTNGSFDAGDYPLANHRLVMQPGNQIAVTDSAGNYMLPATSGVAYKIKPTQLTAMDALLDSTTVTVPLSDTLLTGVDFAFVILSSYSDVAVYVSEVIPAVKLDTIAYHIKIVNRGTRIESGQVSLSHYSAILLVNSTPLADSTILPIVKWNYSNLVPGAERNFMAWLRAQNQNVGSSFTVTAKVTTQNTDAVQANNTETIQKKFVANNYPRNRKAVFPLNYSNTNYAANEYIDYNITFQNTGTTTAANAWIIDTLHPNFDMSTLYVVGASHPYKLTIVGHALRVDFENINLVDTGVSKVMSHGFFRFMIKPDTSQPFFGNIYNKAYIYFSNGTSDIVGTGIDICFSKLNISTYSTNIQHYTCGTKEGLGSVNAISTGSSDFTYLWSSNSSTYFMLTTVPDEYFVTVSDGCGATAVGSVLIEEEESPTGIYSTETVIEDACGSGTGAATITACSDAEPIMYKWNDGQTTPTITGLFAGEFYSYTVTDANGVESWGGFFLAEASSPVIASATNDVCAGTATINASGGDGWYTYQWSNGDTEIYTTDDPGVYYFTVTDGIGCTDTGSISLENASALNAAVIYAVPPDCGGDGYGKIYYFLPFGVQAFIFGSTTPYIGEGSIDNISPGDYSFLIDFIEPQECYITQDVHVETAEEFQLSVSQVSPASCTANNGKLTLSVTANANLSYTILWSNGWQGLNNDNLAAGTYTVTVTFSNQCVSTAAGTVNQIVSNTQVNINMQPVTCHGGNNGSVSVTPFGGSFSYNYAWSTGAQTQTISNLTAGNYTYTVTENNGCTVTGSVLVTQPTALFADVTVTDALCSGGNTGSAILTASGGTGPYTYNWPNGVNPAALAPGVYNVGITDACNNQIIYTVIVNTNHSSVLTVGVDKSDVSCAGANDGGIYVTVCGGVGGYTYTWSHGAQGESVDNLAAGTYTVTVSDDDTTVTQSVTITQPQPISFNVVTDCTAPASAYIEDVQGGNGGYQYFWSNNNHTTSISGVANGVYNITVEDNLQCSATAMVTVQSIQNLNYPNVYYEEGLCGDNGTVAIGSMGNPAFVWATFNGTEVDGTGESFAVEYNTSYQLSVGYTNLQGLCFKDTLIYIPQAGPGLDIDLTALENPVCNGEQNGSITVGASGGTAPYTYLWSNGSNGNTLSNLQSGEIITTVTDANGCTAVDSFTLTQPAAITLSVTTTDAACYGTPTGLIQLNVSGGAGGYTYAWSDTTIQPGGIPAGTYSITITDANGCTLTTSQTITEPVELTGATVATDESVCGAADGSIAVSVAGGVPGYTYLWNNTQTGATANGLLAGTYTVTVTDANGCSVVYQSEVDCVTSIGAQPALKIALYPNPAEDMVYIEVPAGDNYDITMYDMTGRIIMQLNISQYTQVSLVDIAKGLYTIEVKAAQQNVSRVEKLVLR